MGGSWTSNETSLHQPLLVYIDHYCRDSSPVCFLFLQEYENQLSPEAKVVKELDQLEMILQAHEYEELEGNPGRLQEFFISTEGFTTFPIIYELGNWFDYFCISYFFIV